MTVRRFRDDDAAALCAIYYRSVHEVAREKYDAAQLRAWAPAAPDETSTRTRARGNATFVAVGHDDAPVGWIELDAGGLVDMLYCAPEAAGRGVAAQLYASVEALALERGLSRLTADASRLAESFFRKRGWVVDEYEVIERDGVEIPRARMSKSLGP